VGRGGSDYNIYYLIHSQGFSSLVKYELPDNVTLLVITYLRELFLYKRWNVNSSGVGFKRFRTALNSLGS